MSSTREESNSSSEFGCNGCEQQIKIFHDYEPYVNIYAVPVGVWVPYLPEGSENIDSKYIDNKLNKVMNRKVEEMKIREVDFEERLKQTKSSEMKYKAKKPNSY